VITDASPTRYGPLRHRWSGQHRDPAGQRWIDRTDPFDDHPVGRVPCAEPEEVGAAVAAARAAAPGWADTPAEERAGLLRHAADRIVALREDLGRRQVHEMGKPLGDAIGGVDAAVGTIRQFAELGPLHQGRTLQGDPAALDAIHHIPRGVAAVITPWNDPVAIAAQGIAANLAVGNTVVCKPSERASFSVSLLAEAFDHLPPGAVNLVLGDGATGAALVDEDIDVVVFTGSVRAGRTVAVRCAPRTVHPVLELGGNDPLIVDEGVDPGWGAEQLALGGFANAGQICVAVERAYVHRDVADAVVEALVREAGARRTGSGLDPDVQLTPLVDDAHRRAVHDHVADAVARGARCLIGGEIPDGPGALYPATVLVDVPDEARVLHEETFGPVVPVVVVDSFDEALVRAAASEYGLAATVLTPDQAHGLEACRRLPVGTVKVNAVFGGAPGGSADPHGASGSGLGYGPGLLDELTRQRVVHLRAAPRS
jgi:succinate-semialdehyde dehydrogenase/glutarate-semialdehyde dehydrogenase